MSYLVDQLAHLSNFGQRLRTYPTDAERHQHALDTLSQLLGYRAAAIFIWNDAQARFTCAAQQDCHAACIDALLDGAPNSPLRRLAHQRETHIANAQPEVPLSPLNTATPPLSQMRVPLQFAQSPLGALLVERDDRHFDATDTALADIWADQLATALCHQHPQGPRNAPAQRTDRIAEIHRAAASLNITSGDDTPLAYIARAALQTLNLDAIALFVPDPESGHLMTHTSLHHACPVGTFIEADHGALPHVMATGEPACLTHPDELAARPYATAATRCEVSVPLLVDNTVIGVLVAESHKRDHISPEDLRLLRIFGAQAATALHNAAMIDQLRDYNARLHAINHAAWTLNFARDPDIIIDEILNCVCEAFQTKQCALHLVSDCGQQITLHAALGHYRDLGTTTPPGRGVIGIAATESRALLVTNSTEDERCLPEEYPCESSAMIAPLIIMDKTIGVLETRRQRPANFQKSDLDLFATFAAHAAIAIHNVNLINGLEAANQQLAGNFEEMRRLNGELEQYAQRVNEAKLSLEWQIQQLTALHEATRTITSSLDLDTTLKTILDISANIADSTAGAIKLYDEETQELSVRATQSASKIETDSRAILSLPLSISDKIIGEFEIIRSKRLTLSDEEQRMLETMASQAAIAIENARLFESTQRVYYETLKTLTHTIDARDGYTRGHSDRVADLAEKLARRLGLSERNIDKIISAAILHDIGKIGIRDELLLAPRPLTPEERVAIQQHATLGFNILSPLKFLGEVRPIVHYHHERWDGKGYPEGRAGKQIPFAARIIAVADAYDAMTSTRPYREPLSQDEAIAEIRAGAGTQFDPEVVAAFEACMTAPGATP
ncbi:MAG: GAF domain-containing protein [Proteobacteria bacterium]|nr:GAF domain-containing protein [Pseudomonadota bacterium]